MADGEPTGSSASRARRSASRRCAPGQREAIEAVAGRAATRWSSCRPGSGKSAIYQIAGLLIPGATVVVSPLIALQRDQVDDLRERAPRAARRSSTPPCRPPSASEALAELAEDALEFVFLAPEQLANAGRARRAGGRAAVAARRRRGALHLRVGPRLPARLPAARRGGRGARAPDRARAHRDGRAAGARRDRRAARPARPGGDRSAASTGPTCGSRSSASTTSERKRAGAARARSRPRRRPGIVYVATRRAAEELAAALCEDGLRAASYHAGMRAPSATTSRSASWTATLDVVVATTAFGMGVDKAERALGLPRRDRRVARRLLPGGRARRPRRRAGRGVLFYRAEDVGLRRFFAGGQVEVATRSRTVLDAVGEPAARSSRPRCRRRPSSRRRKLATARRAARGGRRGGGAPDGEVAPAPTRRRAEADRGGGRGGGAAPRVRPLARGHDARLRGDRRLPARVRPVLLRRAVRAAVRELRQLRRPGACAAPPADVPFAVGARVAHGQWGEGVVQRYDDDAMVVLFDDVGLQDARARRRARARAARAPPERSPRRLPALARATSRAASGRARRAAARGHRGQRASSSSASTSRRAAAAGVSSASAMTARRRRSRHPARVRGLVVGGGVRVRDQDRREPVLGELEDRAAGAGDGEVGGREREAEGVEVVAQVVVRRRARRGRGSRAGRRRGGRGRARRRTRRRRRG